MFESNNFKYDLRYDWIEKIIPADRAAFVHLVTHQKRFNKQNAREARPTTNSSGKNIISNRNSMEPMRAPDQIIFDINEITEASDKISSQIINENGKKQQNKEKKCSWFVL